MTTLDASTRPHIDAEWRRWIAENLLLGADAGDLRATLMAAGFAEDEAGRELQRAAESPYVAGAQRLRNRLAKHDWVLDNQRRLNRLLPPEIPRRWRLSRSDFLHRHYTTGRPVLITGMLDDWRACTR